ncbi:cyclic nucleotide-binding domain-containing protein [Cellulomonas humilata]|uniref:Cyclic nucleotide-binding domain-containing protein n=1 Tax=Cellulomonas humilata TaxID=144055 RepID=A0A7Y6A072_9CELL|nr:cyclic nucleotide-binding domain-containing protein [Cellulomonas humilata]NUU17296.1 cyclic nucleotide-binding domain-containing protein [Cellulomonas humilata]
MTNDRVEGSVTTVSWIPSESLDGPYRGAFAVGLGHYDNPPADEVSTLERLRVDGRNDAFRFAHRLSGWIEVDDGRVVAAGFGEDSDGVMGGSTVRFGLGSVRFTNVALPLLREGPTWADGTASFQQTFGGRTSSPLPRTVAGAPYIRIIAPWVWTTLRLEIQADGVCRGQLVGASPFPRHWVFDREGQLASKSGLTDWDDWMHHSQPDRTPWGSVDSPAVVTEVESALERQLSSLIMRGAATPHVRRLVEGETLTEQGVHDTDVYLVLDGCLRVEVDGESLGEVGPGAVVGERAALEAGVRTATLTATTAVRVAAVDHSSLDLGKLAELTSGHRREDPARAPDS